MSVSGISSSSFADYGTQSVQNQMQQFRQEFQQLGQDLQSGNLSAAQSDFATLEKNAPQSSSASSAQSSNPIAQAFNQLSQDLQSGNLSGAQQDYATIQQDFQSRAAVHGHHHHGGGGGSGGSEESEISQLLSELGQSLQSGNLSTAQQTYSTLMQDIQQSGQSDGLSSAPSSTQSGSSNLSVTG